jgi:hypothetical protein
VYTASAWLQRVPTNPSPQNPRNKILMNKSVLKDHTKAGKKLIPPFLTQLGHFEHISWTNTIIPEVMWIALLHEKFGFAEGTALALSLAEITEKNASSENPVRIFAGASDFSTLTAIQKENVLHDLKFSKRLLPLQQGLFSLLHFYPTCPLSFLSAGENLSNPSLALDQFKVVLSDLFDKELPRTVFVQATAVYIAFALGRLKVVEGLTLSRFPEIESYPNTEISRRVAAAIRPTVLCLFGTASEESKSEWPAVFWNRGMEIESCSL